MDAVTALEMRLMDRLEELKVERRREFLNLLRGQLRAILRLKLIQDEMECAYRTIALSRLGR